MDEWKNIIMVFKMPIHVLVCKVGRKNMFCHLDFRYFEGNGQNHIHFRLIQVIENSIAWHFLTFTSPSSKLELCISPMLRSRRANAHLLVKFNARTSQRLLNWNPIPKLTIVHIWKTPACLKFCKTSNRTVENLPQRKLWVWAANDARSHPPNFLVFLFELFVAQCVLVKRPEKSDKFENSPYLIYSP